jgi:hypothetical protein
VHQKNLMLMTLNDLQRAFAELPAGKRVEDLAVNTLASLSGAAVTVFSTYYPDEQLLRVSSLVFGSGLLENHPRVREMVTEFLG